MSLAERLLKNSTIMGTSRLSESEIFNKKDMIPTKVPIINTALSGDIDGGISPGLLQIAGQSKHFKTGYALLMAKTYLSHYEDAVVLLYDSEFGSPEAYFKTYDIDMDRVIHTPITNAEEFKFDIMKQLEGIKRGDHVMIIVDSIGNLASKKEVDDALDGKAVADMSRAKTFKSLGRMITPHLTLKNIPMIAINHTYKTLEMYAKDVVSGGTGFYLSSNDIWIIGRQQDKDEKTKEILGYDFIIRIEKSRFVKEKSEFPVSISYENGIEKWSGMLDLALEGNFVAKPKVGWYAIVDQSTGELLEPNYREKDLIENDDFWTDLLKNVKFKEFVAKKYKVANSDKKMMGDE